MNSAKIRIKVGSMELEYDGDPSFLTGGLEALLTTMGDLAGRVPYASETPPNHTQMNGETSSSPDGGYNFSTTTIGAKLGVKTGSDLVVCAMAHLEFVQRKTSSSRAQILAEMRNAKSYFKQTMASNLSGSIDALLKADRINEGAKNEYALTATERSKIEAKIA